MRIEITRVEPAFEGASFDEVGPYEKVVGRAWADVETTHRLNAGIVNIHAAPRSRAGRAQYGCDFYLLKPVDMHRGNRRIFYDVLNRGNKVALHTINDAPRATDSVMRIACNDPATTVDAGNGFLMRQGYTILWSGWQGDALGQEGLMQARLPIATDAGKPILAMNRDEFIFDHLQSPANIPLSYPAATDDEARCSLTVRARSRDHRTVLSAECWRFVSNSQIEITRPEAFDAGAIYEFIYPARDPIVMGLGFAAVRDLVSFMRHTEVDDASTSNPLIVDGRPGIDFVLAYGMSQAGRFLRDFVYQGFNEDLGGRKVFDGLIACAAGSRKTFVNYAFAQPGRFARQHEDFLFPHDQFPFSYPTITDPVSGRTDGILARCEASSTCPKIIQTEGSSDFFQGRASLLVTDGEGKEIPIPNCVRLYHFAGVQHGGGGDRSLDYARIFPSSRYAPNPADFSEIHRALLVALDHWASDAVPPPPSQFPRPSDDALISAASKLYGFPAIPGVVYPGLINELSEVDYSGQPPRPIDAHDYCILVPAIDRDGNEVAGIHVPEIAVPRGTHTGWNPRRERYAEGELSPIGAYFPFSKTKQDRLALGDPRPSLEERYPTDEAYLRQIAEAASDLVKRRLLLTEDVERILEKARRRTLDNA